MTRCSKFRNLFDRLAKKHSARVEQESSSDGYLAMAGSVEIGLYACVVDAVFPNWRHAVERLEIWNRADCIREYIAVEWLPPAERDYGDSPVARLRMAHGIDRETDFEEGTVGVSYFCEKARHTLKTFNRLRLPTGYSENFGLLVFHMLCGQFAERDYHRRKMLVLNDDWRERPEEPIGLHQEMKLGSVNKLFHVLDKVVQVWNS